MDKQIIEIIKTVILTIAFSVLVALVIVLAARSTTTLDPSLPQSERVGETPRSFINRWHDPEMNVTCWQFSQGIDCLPDQFINPNHYPSYAE